MAHQDSHLIWPLCRADHHSFWLALWGKFCHTLRRPLTFVAKANQSLSPQITVVNVPSSCFLTLQDFPLKAHGAKWFLDVLVFSWPCLPQIACICHLLLTNAELPSCLREELHLHHRETCLVLVMLVIRLLPCVLLLPVPCTVSPCHKLSPFPNIHLCKSQINSLVSYPVWWQLCRPLLLFELNSQDTSCLRCHLCWELPPS